VIRTGVLAAVFAAAGTAAFAQSPMTQEQVERRHNVRVFGDVLVSAARYGAELMGRRVQTVDPSVVLLSGTAPRAQGFVIDGHGVFFHVEIPKIDPVVAWALTSRGRDEAALTAIAGLKAFAQQIPDPAQRQMIVNNLLNIERRFLPPGLQRTANTSGFAPAPDASAQPAAVVRPRPIDNADLEYEKLVTEQLVNAMLDYGHQLGLSADEWLTVGARGSEGNLIPGMVFDDTVTIMLRIKGSDLADFRGGRLTRDEARAKVVVREF
jgi:hypothetical protein